MTNKRKIYLDLFNLNENASLEEIKKRFRELAKEFHPDKNKENNAHDRFLLIKEGYDFLINNHINESKNLFYENINLEKERIEKIRLAKERLKEYYHRKQQETSKEIISFFKSRYWKFYKIFSFIFLIYSLINVIDYFLPRFETKTIVSEISADYNGNLSDNIVLIKPNSGKSIFVSNKIRNYILENDSITIKKTIILFNNDIVVLRNKNYILNFKTINSSIYFVSFVSFIMIIPSLMLLRQKEELGYIFLVKITYTTILPFNLFLIINTL